MHYRFKSKADADLIMMGPVGDQILRIVGREPARKGIIRTSDIGAAMGALEAAIAAEEAAARKPRSARDGGPGEPNDDADGSPRVGLAQRAWPMLEMMRRSLAERVDIVWGV